MEHSFAFEGQPDVDLAFSDDSEPYEEEEEEVAFEMPDSTSETVGEVL